MRFEVWYDIKELREYWNRNGYDGNLDYLMNVVAKDPSQLIVWRENDKIVRALTKRKKGDFAGDSGDIATKVGFVATHCAESGGGLAAIPRFTGCYHLTRAVGCGLQYSALGE